MSEITFGGKKTAECKSFTVLDCLECTESWVHMTPGAGCISGLFGKSQQSQKRMKTINSCCVKSH